jgi:RNA polymerase sigma-70 factor, ECF subfamily
VDEPGVPSSRSRINREAEAAALESLRRGQPAEALSVLMTAYGSLLTAFIVRIVRDREIAKDVRQQVFLEAFQGIGKFEGRSSCWTWLSSIAFHRSLDMARSARRFEATDNFDVLEALDWQPDPTMDAEVVSMRRALEHCLGKLPEAQRAELLMRLHHGLTYEEIGEIVGMPAGTIQVRLSRILPRLRRCLRGKGQGR